MPLSLYRGTIFRLQKNPRRGYRPKIAGILFVCNETEGKYYTVPTIWRYWHNAITITRWQQCISATMITRWHYCISEEMVTGWVYWIVNVSNSKELLIARRKHQHLQTSGNDPNYENGMGYQRKRRETEGQKVREGGRMQCFMRKEDKSLIDVENVETTGKRCCHLSWRKKLNSSLCMFFGMKYSSPIFMYIVPMYSRLTTFTKTLPQMSFLFRSGAPSMTLLTAGALTGP